MAKKQVTNEELARMIARGFSHTATKEQFEEIDARLRTVENKLDKALYTEINRLEARVKKLEEKVGIR